MAKRFTKRHSANGYAAMGNSLRRPRFAEVKPTGKVPAGKGKK